MRQVELTGIKNFECREVEQPAIGPDRLKSRSKPSVYAALISMPITESIRLWTSRLC